MGAGRRLDVRSLPATHDRDCWPQAVPGAQRLDLPWVPEMIDVAALFVRQDSIYKTMPGVDCWDIDRDARLWPGGCPVVAHPPCRAWGRLRQFSKPRDGEKDLALLAVAHVRKFGGAMEHPECSSLWPAAGLPKPGEFPDEFGGWSLALDQFHFGHRAKKSTWVYIVGTNDTPAIPARPGKASHCIRPTKSYPRLPVVTKAEREHSPPAFARWLVEIAVRCQR